LIEKSHGIGQYCDITVTPDETGTRAASITWIKVPREGSLLSHPGVYCLRSNETTWGAATLWHSYTMLTDLEAVFRGRKSELGLRPVLHHKTNRTEGHLFITVLVYQLVQAIRRKLEAAGEPLSWTRLREILSVQQRITATFQQRTPCMSARPRSPNRPCAAFMTCWHSMPCRGDPETHRLTPADTIVVPLRLLERRNIVIIRALFTRCCYFI